MSLFNELKRRNVFRVGIAYTIASWLLLQIVDLVLENINSPDWVMQVFMLAMAVGLPIALIIAWAFELTPQGIVLEKNVVRDSSITKETGLQLNRGIIVILVIAVVFLLTDQYRDETRFSRDQITEVQPDQIEAEPLETPPEDTGAPLTTIAVLPFINMSSDPEQEYFSDGITEEILNRLAKIRELQVAARTSVFSFKGQNQDVRQIAKMLGVGTILEGSVRRDGDQIRITAQLIRASNGFHLWSDTYDRKLENIFAIQDDIASQIAEALQISLGISASEANSRLIDPVVYDLYLRARTLHRNRGKGVLEALTLFQQALEIDPEFAPAWAGLAHSYDVVEFYVSDEVQADIGDLRAKSMAAAEKALQLDPELATALHAMGNNLWLQGEWGKAQKAYVRALQLDPDATEIMEDYSHMLLYSMQLEASKEVAERMVALDPFVPVFLNAINSLYETTGEFDKVNAHTDTLMTLSPNFRYTIIWKIRLLFREDRIDELHQYIDSIDLSTWTSRQNVHKAIDWIVNSDQDQVLDEDIRNALEFAPWLALDTVRPDIYFDISSDYSLGRKIPGIPNLLSPNLSPEENRLIREFPETKNLINSVRLPEYWHEVGWPDMCRPVGEDDFECH